LPDEWFERRTIEPQTERGDAAFEKFLVAERWPIGRFHFRHGISPNGRGNRLSSGRKRVCDSRNGSKAALSGGCSSHPVLAFVALIV
jgi:hypothetical protein